MTKKKILFLISSLVYASIAAVLLFIFFVEKFVVGKWSMLLPDEIIYHLKTSIEGTDPTLFYEFFSSYGVIILGIIILLGFIHFLVRSDKKATYSLIALCLASLLFFTGAAYYDFDDQTGLFNYIATHREYDPDNDFVTQMYVDPAQTSITFPEQKRNLIYIFMESTEVTFMDKESGGDFEKNCIPELSAIAKENETFGYADGRVNGAYSLPGTNWTIGGMFAQSSGLPLKLTLSGNSMENSESFFPEITTLGDILKNQGYNNTILLGSDASFGGRREYYKEHGDYAIHDYNYMLETGKIPSDYKVFWGYEDEKLFEFAKEDLTLLAKEDEPFNYNILTVDTHFEDGYVCRLCEDEFDVQYANVYACASRQVSDFIDWVKSQDFYENTTIVIAGDHNTMDNDFCIEVDKDKDYERKAYFVVINSVAENISEMDERQYSVLDAFPTTLAAMGCKIMDGMLGLGTNLYSAKPTLVEELGVELLSEKLSMPSHFFDNYEEVGITDDYIKELQEYVVFSNYTEDDKICFRIDGISQKVNDGELSDGYVEVTLSDGDVKRYELIAKHPSSNDPNQYVYYAKTDLSTKEFKGAFAKAYTTIRDFKDILIGDTSPKKN